MNDKIYLVKPKPQTTKAHFRVEVSHAPCDKSFGKSFKQLMGSLK